MRWYIFFFGLIRLSNQLIYTSPYINPVKLSELLEKKLLAQAEKYRAEAAKLRAEASILEKELLVSRADSADAPRPTPPVGVIKKMFVVKTSNLRFDWLLDINGEAYVNILDIHGNKIIDVFGKWYTKHSRYGIGGNIHLIAKNASISLSCIFLTIKKKDALGISNTYSHYKSIYGAASTNPEPLVKLIDIDESTSLFPIINQESIASLCFKSIKRLINKVLKICTMKFFKHISTSATRKMNKWRKLSQLANGNNTIILYNKPYVVSEVGNIKIKGLRKVLNTWKIDNSYIIKSECMLSFKNIEEVSAGKVSRTGGRAGRARRRRLLGKLD